LVLAVVDFAGVDDSAAEALGSDNVRLATVRSVSRTCLRVGRVLSATGAISVGVARLDGLTLEGVAFGTLASRATGACSTAVSATLGVAEDATSGNSDAAAGVILAATGRVTSAFLCDEPKDMNIAAATAATAQKATTNGRRDFLHSGISG